MTRETKVGLLVSGSFLCLVAVVVYGKYRGGEPSADDAHAEANIPAIPADPTPAAGGEPKKLDTQIQRAVSVDPSPTSPPAAGDHAPVPAPSAAPKEPAVSLPTGPAEAKDPGKPPLVPPLDDPAKPNPAPAPSAEAPGSKPAPSATPGTAPSPASATPPATDPLPAPSTVPSSTPEPGAPKPSSAPAPAVPTPDHAPATSAPTPPQGMPPSPWGAAPTAAPAPAPSPATSPPAESTPLPSATPASPGISTANTSVPATPAAPAPASPTNLPVVTPGPSPTPSGSAQPFPPPPMPGADIGRPVAAPPVSDPSASPTLRPAGGDASDPNVRLGAPTGGQPGGGAVMPAPLPSQPSGGVSSVPPIGAPPRADSPPIAIPGQSPAASAAPLVPQVESYDEETHICRAGESFESISEQHYHTRKYDRALLAFNRNHPRAPDAVRLEPPQVVDGMPVFIPPARILDRQATPASGVVPAAASMPQAAAPSAEPAYRVRRPNEGLWDIARRTLGSGERWTEIWNLNRQVVAEQPVPVGTVLRLPPGARVDPADAP